jgi:hypothetical protein
MESWPMTIEEFRQKLAELLVQAGESVPWSELVGALRDTAEAIENTHAE